MRQHDVVRDDLPTPPLDLIHARPVLVHLPERDDVLRRLAGALKPGGALLVEDFDHAIPLCPEPTSDRQREFALVHRGQRELLHRRGADTNYARTLPWRLRNAGLTDVGAEARLKFVSGGSDAASVLKANALQVGDAIVGAGLASADQVDAFLAATDDPDFLFAMPLLVSAWGRRPL